MRLQVSLLSAVAQATVTAPTLAKLGAAALAANWATLSARDAGGTLRVTLSGDIPGQVFVGVTMLGEELPCFRGQGAAGAAHCLRHHPSCFLACAPVACSLNILAPRLLACLTHTTSELY
jgi:hypothetical protein